LNSGVKKGGGKGGLFLKKKGGGWRRSPTGNSKTTFGPEEGGGSAYGMGEGGKERGRGCDGGDPGKALGRRRGFANKPGGSGAVHKKKKRKKLTGCSRAGHAPKKRNPLDQRGGKKKGKVVLSERIEERALEIQEKKCGHGERGGKEWFDHRGA